MTRPNCKKIFGFTRKSGILMPISSLPSPYGIGSIGKEAYDFVDFLDATGQSCWQVLPLNPTSYGDSPYQSPASVAGNPYFIDLPTLQKKGLLTPEELSAEETACNRVDYGRLFWLRYQTLRKAYSRFSPSKAYYDFCDKNQDWIEDYALFMALKVHYNYKSWTSWEPLHKNIATARTFKASFREEGNFWKWLQFEFMQQWQALLDYAHEKGILIIGDMPIYVAHDSMEVWCAPEQFLLDEQYNPTAVAGCPPDPYSATGQLWGNPIYNWKLMKEQGFDWWLRRVNRSFALYDLLRIDHFRGFASYYSIPAGEPTAVNGHWEKAPGKELFATIRKAYPDAKIIAEDLGFITEDVRELLKETCFPGMKVLQFAFYDKKSEYLPRNYKTDNCIVYTASHDSDCTKSWYKALPADAKKLFNKLYPRKSGQSVTDACIEAAMRSRANLCIITMQDYLELTNEEGRMNIPSVASGNWTWRAEPAYRTEKLEKKIRRLTKAGARMKYK